MIDLVKDCSLHVLSHNFTIQQFDCGNADLNDFFCHDALKYQQELLGETYFFREKKTKKIVCAFTISNDSIKVYDLPNNRQKKVKKDIPREKAMKSFPALLIGRLGVSVDFSRKGVGTQLMDFIKSFALIEFKNRCRFLLVDAYNTPDALSYYQKNEFWFVFSTEDQEREYYAREGNGELKTRFMCFDLMAWKSKLG